jgi:hypothetical protein
LGKRFESPVLIKLTVFQGQIVKALADPRGLKIRKFALARQPIIWIVSNHRKGDDTARQKSETV